MEGEETTWEKLSKGLHLRCFGGWQVIRVRTGVGLTHEELVGKNCRDLCAISERKYNHKIYFWRVSLFQRAILLVWETKKNLITNMAIHWKHEAQICNIFLYHPSKIDLFLIRKFVPLYWIPTNCRKWKDFLWGKLKWKICI